MKRMKSFMILSLALGCMLLIVGQALAVPLVVEFKETGSTVEAYVNGTLTNSGTETAQVTVPFITALSPYGFSFYSYLLESDGVTISDTLLVKLLANSAVITFASDPVTLNLTGAQPFLTNVVEDGTSQLLFQMQSTGGASSYTMFVYGQSEVETTSVPEPASLMLLGTGLMGLVMGGRKKFRK